VRARGTGAALGLLLLLAGCPEGERNVMTFRFGEASFVGGHVRIGIELGSGFEEDSLRVELDGASVDAIRTANGAEIDAPIGSGPHRLVATAGFRPPASRPLVPRRTTRRVVAPPGAPELLTSDPASGDTNVPRTAWLRLGFAASLEQATRDTFELVCGGGAHEFALHDAGSGLLVLNPESELPGQADCHLGWQAADGPGQLEFRVADAGRTAQVQYDRTDLVQLAPFPDDYWLVPDATLPSGRRVELEIGDFGVPLINAVGTILSRGMAERDGYSPVQPFVLAFSHALDPSSLPADEAASIDPASPIVLLDLDPESPYFGERVPFSLRLRSDFAPDWTREHAALLFPAPMLRPAGRYGLVLSTRLFTASDPGRPFVGSDFFRAVAGSPDSSEADEVERARSSVEPVLAFAETLADVPIPRADVALAVAISIRSVAFDPSDLVYIKEQLLAAPPPPLQVSSVQGSSQRAATVWGTIELPIYLAPGFVHINRDPLTGLPAPLGVEAVPFVISLPLEALEGPVPLVIYQHGSPGGPGEILLNFNEFLDQAGYAIAGIQDHANRNLGDSSQALTEATFAILLGQGHIPLTDFQTHADMLGFLRALQGLESTSWLPRAAPDAIPEIDPDRLLFRGISQGSHNSLAFLPFAPEITAAASVVGGGRVYENTLHQIDFYGLIQGIQVLVPEARPSQILWALAVLQNDADRDDSHYLARHLYRDPLEIQGLAETTPPSLLWIEGVGDNIVSNTATRAAARELGIPLLQPAARSTPVLEETQSPVVENIQPGVSAAHMQYDPALTPSCFIGGEGHFCPQSAREAEIQTLHLFSTALDPELPPEIVNPLEWLE
jgi:hypothetical protein